MAELHNHKHMKGRGKRQLHELGLFPHSWLLSPRTCIILIPRIFFGDKAYLEIMLNNLVREKSIQSLKVFIQR